MLPPLEDRYAGTHKALSILETSLLSMTRRRAEFGPNFHFDAVQVVEDILKLRTQIDDIIGLTAFLKEFGPPQDDSSPTPAPVVAPAAEMQPHPAAG